MTKPKLSLLFVLYFAIFQYHWAQNNPENDPYIQKANKAFGEKKYSEAEKKYRLSENKQLSGAKSAYNLGNAIYKQKYPAESLTNYQKSLAKATTKAERHAIYHNIGNAMMKLKNYQGAVEAYKNALKNNPNDDQTRYNYALAKKLLEQNPPPPDNNKQDQNQDNNQNQQNQDQNQDNQDKPQNQDNQQDQDQKEGDGKADPNKRNLEALLDAVENQEKKTQQKVNENQIKGKQVKQEKEW